MAWSSAALVYAGAVAHADHRSTEPGVAASSPSRVVITLAGDVSYPNEWGGMDRIDDKKQDLFVQLKPILDSADAKFVNIECPVTDVTPIAEKRFSIACKTKRLSYITDAGFNLFSLANNHSADAGGQGITDTIALLRGRSTKERPLWWAGTGATPAEARTPARFRPPGKTTLISLFAVANTSGRGKVAGLHDKTLPARISEEAKTSDIVIVSVHHGPEYHHVPRAWTTRKYRTLIDAGADIVVAHHPHVVQGFERYRDGFIFYSMGNFSFGSRTSRHLKTGARFYSVMGRVTFDGDRLTEVEIIPLYVNNKARWTLGNLTLASRHAEPQLLAGPFAKYALDEFDDFSRRVPGNKSAPLIRVGDRSYADLGDGNLTEARKSLLLARQKAEYQAVIDAGAAPVPATEAQMRRKTNAGTPLQARPPEPKPRKRGKTKKAHRKTRKRAGIR